MTLRGAKTSQYPYIDSSATPPVVDSLLSGALNSGLLFLGDLGFEPSYPGGPRTSRPAAGNPANAAFIGDMSGHADGKFVKGGAAVITFSNGGFQFGAIPTGGSPTGYYIEIPASVALDLWTAYAGASQRYHAILDVMLPTKAQWRASAGIAPMLCWGNALYGASSPELFILSQSFASGKAVLDVRRQANGAAVEALTITDIADASFGTHAQIEVYRTAADFGLRLTTGAEKQLATRAAGANNVTDFSTLTGKAGWPPIFTPVAAEQNFKLHRVSIENLARTGRSPLTVGDAQWAEKVATIAALAAKNGGVSPVFN